MRVVTADDRTTVAAAYRLVCAGTALLWQGDFQNAKQLLHALARRIDQPRRKMPEKPIVAGDVNAFHRYRLAKAQRARLLGLLLIPFDAEHVIALRRAPDVGAACGEAFGDAPAPYMASLRELLGMIGAHEWRKRGVFVPALHATVHPHYGVFAPVRNEYVTLLGQTNLLPATQLAFDIGTGTGVLAALLVQRGIAQVVATDNEPRAVACARDNLARLGFAARVSVVACDLFPPGRASLIVCNPPWLPGRPGGGLDRAIYDGDSRMLRGFLAGLAAHLEAEGEGWLLLSDLAEHLGLRSRETLIGWIAAAGLQVIERPEIRPVHPRTRDAEDVLHAARAAEITSLWRLAPAGPAASR